MIFTNFKCFISKSFIRYAWMRSENLEKDLDKSRLAFGRIYSQKFVCLAFEWKFQAKNEEKTNFWVSGSKTKLQTMKANFCFSLY